MAWMVLGYFSLFDLGLGRALTKMVAEKLGLGLERELPCLVGTALGLMMVGALNPTFAVRICAQPVAHLNHSGVPSSPKRVPD